MTTTKKEFERTFVIGRGVVFEVNYRTLASNANPYFATSAGVFNRPRTDYNQCGQCQAEVTTGKAKEFYKKWDKLHLKDLTDKQYKELVSDVEALAEAYPFNGDKLNFSQAVELERAYRGQ